MSIDEIKKLNPKERIILMNEIWKSFDEEVKTIESPSWHQEILEKSIKKDENAVV